MLAALIMVGTFLVPLLQVPDERFHLDMIFTAMDGSGWPEPQGRTIRPSVEAANRLARQGITDASLAPRSRGANDVTAECQLETRQPTCAVKPTFDELARAYSVEGPVNRMTQHPPGYYLVAGMTESLVATLTMRTLPYDGQIWLYRLVSLLLASSLATFSAMTARELGLSRSAATAAALLPAGIVGFTLRNAPMINNDNLLIPALAGLVWMLARIHGRGSSPFRLAVAGAFLGVALITKGTALLAVLAVPISLWLVLPREGTRMRHLRATSRAVAIVAGSSLVFGGWWPLRNLLIHGTPQPAGMRRADATEPVAASVFDWLVAWTRQTVSTGFGSPGNYIINRPAILIAMIMLLAGLVWLGTRRLGWRVTVALNAPLLITFVLWATISYTNFARTGVLATSNARYYYALLVGLFVVLAAGMDAVRHRWRLPAALVPAAVLALVGWATYRQVLWRLRMQWSDVTSASDGITNLRAWAPAPIGLLYMAAILVVVAGGMAVLLNLRESRARTRTAMHQSSTSDE